MPGRGARTDRGEARTGPGCAVGLLVLALFLGGCGLVLGSAFATLPDFGDDFAAGLRCAGDGLVGAPRPSAVDRGPDGAPPLWSTHLAHAPSSPPAVADGRAFVRTVAGEVVALDATTGAPQWTVALAGRSPLGTDFAPVVVGDTLFVTSWDGVVHALDTATGASRWRTPLPADPATTTTSRPGGGALGSVLALAPRGGAPLAVDADSVYVDGVALAALDRVTGTLRWSSPLSSVATGGYSAPVVSGDVVVVGGGAASGRRFARAVDRGTGATKWEVSGDGGAGAFAAPRVTATATGLVFTGLRTHAAVVLDPASGRERSRVITAGEPAPFGSVPAPVGDRVLLRTDRATAIDPATGRRVWAADVGGPSGFDFAPPLVTGATVVTPGGDGRLHALDRANGRERWAIGTPRTNRCNHVSRVAPPARTETGMIVLSAHRNVVALPLAAGT